MGPLDERVDLLVGMTILSAGVWTAVRRPSSARRAGLLVAAGAFWILPTIEFWGLSTLFFHRPLLAAAAAAPAWAWYGWRRSSIPLVGFATLSVTSAWAGVYWLTFVAWLAVVVVSIVPGRRTLWPVLTAETVMLSAASLGHIGHWLTNDDRRWAYYVATTAVVWFVARDATLRVPLDGVLDATSASSASVGFRAAGEDEYRTPAGDVLEIETAARVVHVELDDLGSAVLLHDDPAFDDPAIRVQIERVMRLLASNVTLLRQVDEQRRAMEASRQRLLEADQHAAELMLDEVGKDVLPHLSHIESTLRDCGVSDDHKASVLLVQIYNELRELSSGLGLETLRNGLPAALRELVDASAIPARLEVSPVTMPPRHERVMFMVASEAVANAGKHSAAKHMMIELHGVGDEIELVVSDDGCGGAEHRAYGGLAGLRDRLQRLGGRFEVRSPSGGGTVVLARLPAGVA